MVEVEAWSMDVVERLAPGSPRWLHGLLASLAMDVVVIRGRPAMAVSFVSFEVVRHDGSDGKPMALKSFALAEDEDGLPAMAVDRGARNAPARLSGSPLHRDLGSYAGGWFGGEAAWAMIVSNHPSWLSHDLHNARHVAVSRISGLVASLMDRSGFSEPFKRALRLIATWTPATVGVAHVFDQGPKGIYLRELAARSPTVCELLCGHSALGASIGSRATSGTAGGLGPLTGLSRAHLSWLGCLDQGDETRALVTILRKTLGADAFLELLPSIPADWLPRDGDQVRAMLETCIILLRSGNLVPSKAMALAPCKGDWVGFVERCTRMHGRSLPIHDMYASPLKDPVSDFASKVVLPVDAHRRPEEEMHVRDGYVHTEVAANLLYRAKSLPACLGAARWWHEHLNEILSSLPYEPDHFLPWEPLFAPTEVNGLRLVALSTALDLSEEGSAGRDGNGVPGLAHCVRTYHPMASAGLCHIVSVRRASKDGGYVRLATAELVQSGDGTLTMVQVQGHGNGLAPAEAVEAMQAFLALNPSLPHVPPRGMPGDESGHDETRRFCGFDWTDPELIDQACKAYAPMLARHLRKDASSVRAAIVREIDGMLNPWFPESLRAALTREPPGRRD